MNRASVIFDDAERAADNDATRKRVRRARLAVDYVRLKREQHFQVVGDSYKHDIEGALNAGWRAVLIKRSGDVPYALPPELPVITTLLDLLPLLAD